LADWIRLVVRELAPEGRGILVEFYVFTSELRCAHYERLQAEILDQILAVLPQRDKLRQVASLRMWLAV